MGRSSDRFAAATASPRSAGQPSVRSKSARVASEDRSRRCCRTSSPTSSRSRARSAAPMSSSWPWVRQRANGRPTRSRLATATWTPAGRWEMNDPRASRQARAVMRWASSMTMRTGRPSREGPQQARDDGTLGQGPRRDRGEGVGRERIDAVEGGCQVREQHDRVVVAVVDGQPGDRSLTRRRPTRRGRWSCRTRAAR